MNYKETKYLCRLSVSEVNRFSNLIFIGNGAVENGEKPLKDWFFLIHNERENKELIRDKIHFNLILATFSLKMRAFRGSINTDSIKELFILKDSKEKLGKIYSDSFKNNRILPRRIPECMKNYIYKEDTLVVCYNWDPVFWELKDKNKLPLIKNIIQPHGSCLNPSTIIFPCEYTMDYARHMKHHLAAPDISDDDLSVLLNIQRIVLEALESSDLKRIFFWGLALNDYDAEIIGSIESSMLERKNLNLTKPDLWVINPDIFAAYRTSYITEIFNFNYVNPIYSSKNSEIKI